MGKVITGATMSIDGYIAAPGEGTGVTHLRYLVRKNQES